jgi:hypothetical protein
MSDPKTMQIRTLPVALDPESIRFIDQHPEAMVYHSPEWMGLVAELTRAEVRYLALFDDRDACRAIAPVTLRDGMFGTIANSSPYFGSHGGILAADDASFSALANGLMQFLLERQVVAANIIEPLFAAQPDRYMRELPIAETDRRTGQVKDLAGLADDDELLGSLGGLARSNLKRRAWRTDLRLRWDGSVDALKMLYDMHRDEMASKPDGNAKTWQFFDGIQMAFAPGSGYRVYLAEHDGAVIAGLLVLLWRDFVEYITPASRAEAREHQALSALIFRAMADAIAERRRWFNFGGTWASQHGLLAFKNSWGVNNREYRYYVLDLGGLSGLRSRDRGELLKEYHGFYVYPF